MFRRGNNTAALPPVPPVTAAADIDEARKARIESTQEFLDVVDQGLEVRQRTSRLRDRRTVNHFTELLERSVYGS